jgi:large subunit ribosomal protein L25
MAKYRPKLKVEKRELTGNQVKQLRRQGDLPAVVYGPSTDTINVKVDSHEVEDLFYQVGETGLINLEFADKRMSERTVMIKNPQYEPISGDLIHMDFYQVDLSQTVTVDVPIELSGVSPADKSGEGVLVQQLSQVEVEALPDALPEKFVVDISGLEEIDDTVTVKELDYDEDKVDLHAEEDQIIAKIEPLMEEIEEPVSEEEVLLGEEELEEVVGEEEVGPEEVEVTKQKTDEEKAEQAEGE